MQKRKHFSLSGIPIPPWWVPVPGIPEMELLSDLSSKQQQVLPNELSSYGVSIAWFCVTLLCYNKLGNRAGSVLLFQYGIEMTACQLS